MKKTELNTLKTEIYNVIMWKNDAYIYKLN